MKSHIDTQSPRYYHPLLKTKSKGSLDKLIDFNNENKSLREKLLKIYNRRTEK
jgi:hypothetical protein